MTPQLRIESPTITLRTLGSADAGKLFQMSQEADLRKWIPSQVYRDLSHSKEVLKYLISQYEQGADPRTHPIVLGIVHTPSGVLIGHVGLSPYQQCVEIGFAIEDSHQRKGYATAAVRTMCGWAVKEYGLDKIHAFVAKENEASRQVLLRTGFIFVEERTMLFQGSLEQVKVFEFASAQQKP